MKKGLCFILYSSSQLPTRSFIVKNLTLTVALASMAMIAVDACGDWAIKGEGNFTCPDYVAARKINGAKLYSSVTWVQGFISGVNYQAALEAGTDSYIARDMPAVSIVNWLENHCREYPGDFLSDAAEALIVELKEKNSR